MKRILVADDSVTIQKVIALTFADEPFEVQSVGTGAEALELINSWKPDIVLADVIMPQMNGYELCRAVKGQQESSSTPVILLAGTFEAFDEEEAKSVGADDYITKPFESGELIEKVNVLTGGAPALEPQPEPEVDIAETAPTSVPVPEQPAPVSTPPLEEPQGIAIQEAGQEPDIWDILSDTEGGIPVAERDAAGAAVPGMRPLEDQVVVDVGSFDVGLDRPEQAVTPHEITPQALAEEPLIPPEPGAEPEPPQTIAEEPSGPSEPGTESGQPQPVSPVETPIDQEPIILTEEESVVVSSEKSRVEDREKDFFGFETEGLEAAAGNDLLGDVVEEITFDVEKPVETAGEADQEASFVVPEPVKDELPVTGETVLPETMAPEPIEQPAQEHPPPAGFPEVPEVQIPEPVVPQIEEQSAAVIPEPPIPVRVPEPEPEPSIELEAEQPPEAPAKDIPSEPDEAEIKRMIEERVEKIAWEVVPEMAEILIRETIEKIKGGS